MFFAIILAKKFTNPSSDIIEVLAGLDNVDLVFSDLVATLDSVIKDGRTRKFRNFCERSFCTDSKKPKFDKKQCIRPLPSLVAATKQHWSRTSFTVISSRL